MNFVVPYDDAALARLAGCDPDAAVRAGGSDAALFSHGGPSAWCMLTYLRLRARSDRPLRLSNRPDRAAINVVHAHQLAGLGGARDCFFVSARADLDNRLFAHAQVVQNRAQSGPDAVWIDHWPQPGLLARERPIEAVRAVGYLGIVYNGNLALGEEYWTTLLATRGMAFVKPEVEHWHDYRALDAVIAVRSLDERAHPRKPASKLINAWHAGVPFVGGADSAYAQIGRAGHDYLRVTSVEEIMAALDALAEDPGLRQRLIANGREAARRHGDEVIARRWLECLDGPIAARWRRWRRAPRTEAARSRLLGPADALSLAARASAKAWLRRGR